MVNNNKVNVPTIFVILGVTGDLSQREIIPALFDLFTDGYLPDKFKIVGFSRRNMKEEEFEQFIKNIISKSRKHSSHKAKKFLDRTSYQQGFFNDIKTYRKISDQLRTIDDGFGQCSNKLFYLAVPPIFYDVIFQNLHDSMLAKPCSDEAGWTRVLVEKPFGKDVKTAQKLDKKLGKLFKEEQIFRIDHYLAKETVQNILSFRFSNLIFEPIWNSKYIEKVEIKFLEDFDIRKRGDFYDNVGALRDVGQNHMLQMLALIAMGNPWEMKADLIRKKRDEIIKSIEPIKKEALKERVVRGQYVGYKNSKGVHKNSKTETYFKMKVYIGHRRWKGVPFYLESGKALNETKTEINIYFKKIIPCFCAASHKEHEHRNLISFKIKPAEGIKIRFWAKNPGLNTDIEHKDFSFNYEEGTITEHDAYKKILLDCMKGDQTLFTDTKEVGAAWKFITPIINNWNHLKLYEYKKGSKGPGIGL
ncbi:glucose-6-phosphate 1-dehydrogenase [bacterium BMS3Abin15]|nr:glucose-6-phosphate 1-dehydrogenase [bacterium BMS3Abin15]HDZ85588.1 glucose-6-phosphate dehydrogenase [Candidatus Moranbacteria bacterium]